MRAFVTAWRAMFEDNREESVVAAEQAIQLYLDPEGMFYMGLILARLGESGRALQVLNDSIDRGFYSPQVLLRNPWFDGLRSRSEFSDLVKRAQKKYDYANETWRSAEGTDSQAP